MVSVSEKSLCVPDVNKFLVTQGLADWKAGSTTEITFKREVKIEVVRKAIENMNQMEGKVPEYKNNTVTYLLGLAGNDIVTMAKNQDNITTLENLTIDSFVSVILAIAYFIVFICLFIVLMARLVVIWIVIAFSPILVLEFVMGDKFKITDKIGDVKIFKEFFMPMMVAFPIVIGHIMLKAGKEMTVTGASGDSVNTTLFDNMFGGYNFMWKMAAIIILWMGVFAAMNDSIAKGVVSTIKGGAESTAKFALKSLRYAPVFPVKVDHDNNPDTPDTTEKFSLAGLSSLKTLAQESLDSSTYEQKARLGELTGLGNSQMSKDIHAVNTSTNLPEAQKSSKQMISNNK